MLAAQWRWSYMEPLSHNWVHNFMQNQGRSSYLVSHHVNAFFVVGQFSENLSPIHKMVRIAWPKCPCPHYPHNINEWYARSATDLILNNDDASVSILSMLSPEKRHGIADTLLSSTQQFCHNITTRQDTGLLNKYCYWHVGSIYLCDIALTMGACTGAQSHTGTVAILF